MRRSPGTSVDEPVELEITRMRRRHLKGVMAIERQVYPRPWSPNLFLSEMSELRNRTYLVAKIGKDVVGYGGLMCYGEEAHITTIAVDPDYQGYGIGELLLLGLIDRAQQIGARWLTLEVRVSNKVAQRLYEKYTFKEMGVRRRYYSDNGEDALVMWADALDSDSFRAAFAANERKLGQKLGAEIRLGDSVWSVGRG